MMALATDSETPGDTRNEPTSLGGFDGLRRLHNAPRTNED